MSVVLRSVIPIEHLPDGISKGYPFAIVSYCKTCHFVIVKPKSTLRILERSLFNTGYRTHGYIHKITGEFLCDDYYDDRNQVQYLYKDCCLMVIQHRLNGDVRGETIITYERPTIYVPSDNVAEFLGGTGPKCGHMDPFILADWLQDREETEADRKRVEILRMILKVQS